MKQIVAAALFFAFILQLAPFNATAGPKKKCACVGTFQPPKGVYRLSRRKIDKSIVTRYHCLPCGNRIPYTVEVITYRERYSNGQTRIWKCDVAGTEVTMGK